MATDWNESFHANQVGDSKISPQITWYCKSNNYQVQYQRGMISHDDCCDVSMMMNLREENHTPSLYPIITMGKINWAMQNFFSRPFFWDISTSMLIIFNSILDMCNFQDNRSDSCWAKTLHFKKFFCCGVFIIEKKLNDFSECFQFSHNILRSLT